MCCHNLNAQRILIAGEIDSSLRAHCSICGNYEQWLPVPVFVSFFTDSIANCYHESHHALKTADLRRAGYFAALLMDKTRDSSGNLLYTYGTFLQGKIHQHNNLPENALRSYRQYLSYQPDDFVLNYHAHVSIISILYKSQDRQGVLKAFNHLHSELSFEKKSC